MYEATAVSPFWLSVLRTVARWNSNISRPCPGTTCCSVTVRQSDPLICEGMMWAASAAPVGVCA